MVNFTPISALADIVYGLDLLATLGLKEDDVAVFDSTSQVFIKARPLKASIRETSRIMEHPAETGVVLADHKIINPVEVELSMVIPAQYYATTYQEIKTAFTQSMLLSVKTPVNIFQNMIVANMPHEEAPEHYNAIILNLQLRQIIFEIPNATQSNPANYSPATAAAQNTVRSGLVSAAAIGIKALAAATAVASYASLIRRF